MRIQQKFRHRLMRLKSERRPFMGNEALPRLIVAQAITRIGVRAFNSCTALKFVSFSVGSALRSIGGWAFLRLLVAGAD
jgi:hypothetical protein